MTGQQSSACKLSFQGNGPTIDISAAAAAFRIAIARNSKADPMTGFI
jgi:hypothetical protein